jgi:hypothetical protein
VLAATIGFCRRHACHYKVCVQASVPQESPDFGLE